MLIALINKSKHVPDAQAALMARFASVDLEHLASDWGQKRWTCAFYANPDHAPPPPEASRCYLLDDPDVSGALGYHDVDPQGHPYIKAFVVPTLDHGGTVIPMGLEENANSVLCTLTHETKEEAADAYCGQWVQMSAHALTAQEACDGCEDRAYAIKLGDGQRSWVSDHLLPPWFAPGQPGPYTHGDKSRAAKAITQPFQITPGGYRIDWKASADPTQTFASTPHWGPAYPEWKKALKQHPRSRTMRILRPTARAWRRS